MAPTTSEPLDATLDRKLGVSAFVEMFGMAHIHAEGAMLTRSVPHSPA